jgi:hypothetical protein
MNLLNGEVIISNATANTMAVADANRFLIGVTGETIMKFIPMH